MSSNTRGNAGGFGSMTWANEPPSEEEQFKVKQERNLMRAILGEDRNEVERILAEHGNIIDINFESSGKSRPLHAAVSAQDEEVGIEIVRLLLEAKAEINVTNSLGYTPLFVAVVNEKRKVCEYLMKQPDIDLTRTTKKNETLKELATPLLVQTLKL